MNAKQQCVLCQDYADRNEIQRFGKCMSCYNRECYQKDKSLDNDLRGKWGVFVVKSYVNDKAEPDYSSLLSCHTSKSEALANAEQQKILLERPDIVVERI